VLFRFRCGATAIWDANRYNEADTPTPRYTFGSLRSPPLSRMTTKRQHLELTHNYLHYCTCPWQVYPGHSAPISTIGDLFAEIQVITLLLAGS